jgi:hypothetical protein
MAKTKNNLTKLNKALTKSNTAVKKNSSALKKNRVLTKDNNSKILKLQKSNLNLNKKLNQALTSVPKVGKTYDVVVNLLNESTYMFEQEISGSGRGRRWSVRPGLAEGLSDLSAAMEVLEATDPSSEQKASLLWDGIKSLSASHQSNHGGVDYEGNLLLPAANGDGTNSRFNYSSMFVDLTKHNQIPPKALITGIYLKLYTTDADAPKMKCNIYYQKRKFPEALWGTVYRHLNMPVNPGHKTLRTLLKKSSGGYDGEMIGSYPEGFLRDNHQMRIKVSMEYEDDITLFENKIYSMRIRYIVQ